MSFSFLLFGTSPYEDDIELGGGGRGGGLWDNPDVSVLDGSLDVLGAGVGLVLA